MASDRRWRPLSWAASLVVLTAIFLAAAWTWSSFSATTSNPADAVAAGTVALSDNDSGTAVFSLSKLAPGDTDSGCVQVTSTGTLPSLVKLYGATSGTGLDAYLTLTVTRGTVSSGSFDDCTNFTADATNYAGLGAGVLYSGLLNAYPTTYVGGVSDPRTATVPEVWTTSEVHAYKLTLTVADVNAAQGLNMTEVFTWEARNTTLYSQVILSDQPAGYWKLDEAAGTTATDATGSTNGTYTNGPVLNQTTGVKDAGTAVSFDGSNDYVATSDTYDYAATSSFSAEVWFKRDTGNQTAWRRLFSKERYVSSSDRGGWAVMINASSDPNPNMIAFERFDGAAGHSTMRSTTTTAAGTWYHVVVTYDGTNMKVYVNGALESTLASSLSVENHTQQFQLGKLSNGASYYSGLMDEAAVYGYALSAQQVSEHYNAGRR